MKRLNIISLAAAAMVLTLPTGASGQLRDYLHEGLESNLSLQIVRGDEQQAANNASFANSGYLPTLDLNGSYQLSDMDNVSRQRGAASSVSSNDGRSVADFGVDLSWVLFDGFSVRTTHARMQELNAQSQVKSRMEIEDFVATFASEYYNVIRQKSQLEIYEMASELSRERLRIVKDRYDVGSYSLLDLQQARVDFNADSASYIRQRELLSSSRIRLNTLLAREDLMAPIAIVDTTIVVDEGMNYEALRSAMEQSNTELLLAEKGVELAQMDYDLIASRNYPSVKLTSGYGYTANSYRSGNTEFSSSLGVQAKVSVNFALFDTKRRVQRKNAKIDRQSAELSKANVELQLRSQLSDLWMAYSNNLSLLQLERSNVGAAQENYDIAMERYLLGDLSGIAMREAQQSLMDAEGRILSATYNTKLCEISLLLVSGQIESLL